ncbi:MAG: excisionase [Candidatus Accumulibacter sp.]|jgi:predicted site-specific integrase-resolvase|nr:excisionase [Accumulibacter sp.]
MTAILSLVTRQPRQPAKLVSVQQWASARYETPPSRQTLTRWCERGNIGGAVREGRTWYVPADAIYSAVTPEEWRIVAYGQ